MNLTPLQPWIAQKIGGAPAEFSLERLRAYQLRQLNQTLALVKARSRFYRQHLAEAPASLTTLTDLRRLPFTTAADLRREPLAFVCVSQSDIKRVVTLDTSGTTGPPKRLYFTAADQELTLDFFHIGMSTFTGPGDRVLILLPGERPGSVGDLLATALPRLGAVGLKHGPGHSPAETWAVLRREQITGVVGMPAQVLPLVRHPDAPSLRLKSVLLTADHVPPAIVQAVAQGWGCRVYNHYGMTETGLGGGVECEARRGYHLREADLYFEIIDPATGEPLPPGEAGEIVVTTLTRQGMPLIRYRTGDLSRFVPGDCPCGAALPGLERVRARLDGRVNLGGGQWLTMADLDDALFPLARLLNFSAAIQVRKEMNRLNIDVVTADGYKSTVKAGVAGALDPIPAVRLARQVGALAVDVVVHGEGEAPPISPGKRKLRQI